MSEEVNRAMADLNQAVRTLNAILELPTEVGARIRWTFNGVVWTRVGDDQWVADDHPVGRSFGGKPYPYRSSHVASGEWEFVS